MMAVRVIDAAPDPEVRNVTCQQCGSRLEYHRLDRRKRVVRAGGQVSGTHYWINCAACSREVQVPA